jgi:uncharacterized phage protein (TIGR02220 family)
MARIRTVKPEFFRDEDLQDLEAKHPGSYPMLVYAGLWGHCDKNGVFEWRPRTLKLDILPFLTFDMVQTLAILSDGKFISSWMVGEDTYGFIPKFTEHQRISGKELEQDGKYPLPPREVIEKHRGSTGADPESQEGKGREGKGREVLSGKPDLAALRLQAKEILAFLNEKAGKDYKQVASNVDLIVALLKAGATPDDIRAVIAKKVREWKNDPKMWTYLRPATLFGPKNYWQKYEGELGKKDAGA